MNINDKHVSMLVKLDIKKFSRKTLKGTELNRCKKYGDKLDEIAEQV